MKERFFIAYDFISDKRRAKFVKTIEKYGLRIQYSLFEFELTKPKKIELFAKLEKNNFFEDEQDESIIIIPISVDYKEKIKRYGAKNDVFDKNVIFVV